MYQYIGKLYPAPLKKRLEKLLSYSKIRTERDSLIGFTALTTLLLALLAGFGLGYLFSISALLVFLLALFLLQALLFILLLLSAERTAKLVESVLPDALQLMASNLRAGMTNDRALFMSSRPEFGPLAHEINLVGKKVMLGEELEDSLHEMTRHIKSQRLEKVVELIPSGTRSGGQLAMLLEHTAADLRRQSIVDKKVRASVNMYVIFIFIAAGIASPVLFGLSSYLVEVLSENISSIDLPPTVTALPISLSKISISPAFVIQFSVISLITTSLLASFVLGLISKGKESEGFKFMIPLLFLSLSLFFASRYIVSHALGGLFG